MVSLRIRTAGVSVALRTFKPAYPGGWTRFCLAYIVATIDPAQITIMLAPGPDLAGIHMQSSSAARHEIDGQCGTWPAGSEH
jgi:hypothetical protein